MFVGPASSNCAGGCTLIQLKLTPVAGADVRSAVLVTKRPAACERIFILGRAVNVGAAVVSIVTKTPAGFDTKELLMFVECAPAAMNPVPEGNAPLFTR